MEIFHKEFNLLFKVKIIQPIYKKENEKEKLRKNYKDFLWF